MNEIASAIFPKVPEDLSSIVKPEELVDIVEMSPLTLQDRRIYNLLIGNAWNNIFTQSKHSISRKQLTEHCNSNNHDLEASFRRLMSSIVQIRINRNRDGESSVRQISLLGSNEIGKRSNVTYSFPPDLVQIIRDTQIFARLHTKVMFELSSKYSLALYEFLQRRCNLQYIHHETLTVEAIRGLLGVPSGQLKSFGHLNKYAIQPAIDEVSFLTEYKISAEPKRTGRTITHLKIYWFRKTDTALEIAKTLTLEVGTGWDIYAIHQDFIEYTTQKGEPLNNPDKAFIGFVKKKIEKQPQ